MGRRVMNIDMLCAHAITTLLPVYWMCACITIAHTIAQQRGCHAFAGEQACKLKQRSVHTTTRMLPQTPAA